MRLFFAVLLPDEMISRVADAQEGLKREITDSGVKWTRPEQFHFTVKFLGATPPEKLQSILAAARSARDGRNSFEVSLGGLGAFPTMNRPGILWVGVKKGAESLASLALQLDGILVKYGYKIEKRPLTPHITLARIKTYSGEAEAAKILKTAHIDEIGTVSVDRFVLMRSTLQPTGSEYTVVEEFPYK